MATKRSTRAAKNNSFAWPKRALALFALILVIVFGLIFFTGSKSLSPKLGIDLQGGTRITLVPQGAKPSSEQLDQARRILSDRVNGMGVSGAEVRADGSNLVITVPGENVEEARALGKTSQLVFRPVVQQPAQPDKGVFKEVEAMANRWVEVGAITPEVGQQKLDDLMKFLKQQKVPDAPKDLKVTAKAPAEGKTSVEQQKNRDKMVKVLLEDRQSDKANKQEAARALLTCEGSDKLAGADDPSKPFVTCDNEGQVQVLGPAPLLEGSKPGPDAKFLTGAMIDGNAPITGGLNPQTAQMSISFKFKTGKQTPGGETWFKFGQQMLQQQVAITLDSKVISAPVIQEPTPPGNTSQITGEFSEKEAQDIANNLRYGALPISFVGENGEPGGTTTTISPTLGEASLKAGLIAGAVGLALIAIYALVYYRGLGVIAIVSLLAAFALVYGLIVLLGRWIGYSLDLAGIAGLIIGLGTTADSFVIYFERIKDEIRDGSTFRSSVPRAWQRARRTIVTGKAVSLFGALVLYFLAIGEVKGFAFTLGLTTIFDLLIAFLVSAPLVILASRRPAFAAPRLNGLGSAFRAAEANKSQRDDEGDKDSSMGFFGKMYNGMGGFRIIPNRRKLYSLMAAMLVVAIGAILIRGFTLGIDFQGGTRIAMPPAQNVTQSQVEETFKDAIGIAPQSAQTVGSGDSRVIEVTSERLSEDQIRQVRSALFEKFHPKNAAGEVSENAVTDSTVSESWGKSITQRMLLSLGVFLLIVFTYITIRLERDMALAAIVTILLDLAVVAGLYALIGFEVSPATVIGLLTILAFSLYDVVVVFDKIRENTSGLFGSTRSTFDEQANLALNQTIMRSINTSIFSAVPIVSLLVVAVGLMGVGTLKDLALVQFIGVIVGTFNSIFFAAPLLATIKSRQRKYREHNERVRKAREGGEGKNDQAVEMAGVAAVGATSASDVAGLDRNAGGTAAQRTADTQHSANIQHSASPDTDGDRGGDFDSASEDAINRARAADSTGRGASTEVGADNGNPLNSAVGSSGASSKNGGRKVQFPSNASRVTKPAKNDQAEGTGREATHDSARHDGPETGAAGQTWRPGM